MRVLSLGRAWASVLEKSPWNISQWVPPQPREMGCPIVPTVATSPLGSLFRGIESLISIFSFFSPCWKTWFTKALGRDLNSVVDHVFHHIVFYVTMWYPDGAADGAREPSQKWPCPCVCMGLSLRFATVLARVRVFASHEHFMCQALC